MIIRYDRLMCHQKLYIVITRYSTLTRDIHIGLTIVSVRLSIRYTLVCIYHIYLYFAAVKIIVSLSVLSILDCMQQRNPAPALVYTHRCLFEANYFRRQGEAGKRATPVEPYTERLKLQQY